MLPRRSISFKITSVDSLGQGVSKVSDKITFIPKTTVGDEGEALVLAEKKGVAFARIKSLLKASPDRQEPECPHFKDCPSCHFQHVSYENELKFKRESLERLFFKLKTPPIEVIGSPIRVGYRNRVQLHYNLNSQKLGMLDAKTNQILSIPQCIIAEPKIQDEIKRLYLNQNWLKEAPKTPRGHVEIYWRDNKLSVAWNRPYAEGGFTQVFEEMNQKLKETLKSSPGFKESLSLLDLFGGNGNLSNGMNYSKRLCVDMYQSLPGSDFLSQDLYGSEAFKKVSRELERRSLKIEHLLLDPPRSGMKDLNQWLEILGPKFVSYVSCDPHTMVRDVGVLKNYEIKRFFLFDFFPSTFHYETMLFLEKRS